MRTRSKNSIDIYAPPLGSSIYLIRFSGSQFYRYFSVSAGKINQPALLASSSTEEIYTSDVQDDYGNKDCSHSYIRANLVLMSYLVPELTYKYNFIDGWGLIQDVYRNGRKFLNQSVPGKGPVSSNNRWIVNDIVTDDFFQSSYYDAGGKLYVYTQSITSLTIPTDPLGKWTCTYECKTTFTSHGVKVFHGDFSHMESHTYKATPTYIGRASKPVNCSDIFDVVKRCSSVSIRSHIVPDKITDDIYSSLTIPDVNNIENLKDLKEIRKSLPPILELLRKRSFKSLSQFYLWYKYSYSTTVLDLKAYYTFFQKWASQVMSPSDVKRTTVVYTEQKESSSGMLQTITRHQIYSDTYNAGVLTALGLNINLSNTWDLLPFSFVVDWFINLGDILARIDHTDVLAHIKVRTVISSTKSTMTSYPLLALGCTSSCYGSAYYRTIGRTLPQGNIEVSLKNPGSHLLDGTALIVSRK